MTTYSIVQMGSLKTGWAIEIDGVVRISYPSPLYLGARLEAMLNGASDGDAALIAKAIRAAVARLPRAADAPQGHRALEAGAGSIRQVRL